jgi:hypothetical protein
MLGAIIIVVILIVAIPVAVILTGAVVAAILGWSLRANAEAVNEGGELIDLNV